jgi:uncharacterized membrane protein YeiH
LPPPNPTNLFTAIDFLGVFAGAIGGTLAGRRNQKYDFDIVGILGLGITSAVGGGILRDVLIQRGPPLALVDPYYLYLAILGSCAGLLFGVKINPRVEWLLSLIDSAALGLFAVAGCTRALAAGLMPLPAILL